MARRRKRRFSNNQLVVFRYSSKNLVGKVCNIKPIGKTYLYDVECENGKIYNDLEVDAAINASIDTHLTKLYYQKYNISESEIPEIVEDEPRFKFQRKETEDTESENLETFVNYDDEGILYDLNDSESE